MCFLENQLQLVCALKGLYGCILSGRETAVWDPVQNFMASKSPEAGTRYAFFIKHFPEIVFSATSHRHITQRIELVEKYRKKAMTRRIAVIPAGKTEIDSTGRSTKKQNQRPVLQSVDLEQHQCHRRSGQSE